MKKAKTYRLSAVTVKMLEELKAARELNETEIIEKAIDILNALELFDGGSVRRMDGTLVDYRIR